MPSRVGTPPPAGWYDPAPTLADSTRHQQWKPREQYFARLNHRWRGTHWDLGYKGEAFQDRITNRGRPRAPYHETAFDEQYLTHRLDNAVFAEGRGTGDAGSTPCSRTSATAASATPGSATSPT
ncbi:MAG: hypothetical protein IPM49_08670 [Flavobacteriales bacterium]|nr:hypothetical protein [Flavobacteriales bacterium]